MSKSSATDVPGTSKTAEQHRALNPWPIVVLVILALLVACVALVLAAST